MLHTEFKATLGYVAKPFIFFLKSKRDKQILYQTGIPIYVNSTYMKKIFNGVLKDGIQGKSIGWHEFELQW